MTRDVMDLAGMDVSTVLAPALGLGASGALLAVRGTAMQRHVPTVADSVAPLPVLAGLLLAGAFGFATAAGTPVGGVLRWLLGLAAGGGCIAAGWTAGQLWRHAELLRFARPTPVDEALRRVRQEGRAQWFVLDGWLGAAGEVTSPGGVVCAFYEAELRAVGEGGAPGALLARERGASLPIELRGLTGSVRLRFSSVRSAAPVQVRRALIPVEKDTNEVPAEGVEPAIEALSWEAVGKLGARALALGRLERDGQRGWRIVGIAGGAAPVVLPSEQDTASAAWKSEAWRWAGVAVPLAMLAALCFGRAV
jgi:hypothetical protein